MFPIGRKYLYQLRQISADLEKLAVVQHYMNYFFILTFFKWMLGCSKGGWARELGYFVEKINLCLGQM